MQKFSEFVTEAKKGTYSGGKFTKFLNEGLISFSKQNNIPNINNEPHVTILFSRKHLPNYKGAGKVSYKASVKDFHVFEGETKVLVLTLESPDLVNRHNELMTEHEATYDFPEYIPHVTLSYDLGDYNIDNLNIEDLDDLDFTITEEYQEDLNLDWKNTKDD